MGTKELDKAFNTGVIFGLIITVIVSVFVGIVTSWANSPELKSPGQAYKLYQEATDRELKSHITTINKETIRHNDALKVK